MLKSENQKKYVSELKILKKTCQITKKEKDKYIEELSKIDRTAVEQRFNFGIVFKISEYRDVASPYMAQIETLLARQNNVYDRKIDILLEKLERTFTNLLDRVAKYRVSSKGGVIHNAGFKII